MAAQRPLDMSMRPDTDEPQTAMAHQHAFPGAAQPEAEELPGYVESQRAAIKQAREEWYRAYAENVRKAETDFTGNTGDLRIPPNNIVSGIVKAAFAIKHKVKQRKGKDKGDKLVQEITVEERTSEPTAEANIAAPDYERIN